MSRKGLRIVVSVVAATGLAGAASGLAASGAHTATPQKAYRVSATLKGTGRVSGLFSANLTTNGTTGKLAWKLTLKPSGPTTAAQIRAGAAGKLLLTLCTPCSVGSRGANPVSGVALTTLVAGRAVVVVQTRSGGTLHGAFKATPVPAGQPGGISITPTPALVAKGKALVAKLSCQGCHTIDGTKSTGPTWKGLAGSRVHLTDGTTVIATDSYLVGVITDASTLKVEGYDPAIMSSMVPPGAVSQAQAEAIVAYIKTVK